jgi:hypothetical protein
VPNYDFEDGKGNPVTLFLDMGQAPEYGEWRTYAGRRLKRVFERAHTIQQPYVPNYACVVRSLPRWTKGARRYDAQGHALIAGRREHEEFKAAQEGSAVWE